jgi:hypothetical protein
LLINSNLRVVSLVPWPSLIDAAESQLQHRSLPGRRSLEIRLCTRFTNFMHCITRTRSEAWCHSTRMRDSQPEPWDRRINRQDQRREHRLRQPAPLAQGVRLQLYERCPSYNTPIVAYKRRLVLKRRVSNCRQKSPAVLRGDLVLRWLGGPGCDGYRGAYRWRPRILAERVPGAFG